MTGLNSKGKWRYSCACGPPRSICSTIKIPASHKDSNHFFVGRVHQRVYHQHLPEKESEQECVHVFLHSRAMNFVLAETGDDLAGQPQRWIIRRYQLNSQSNWPRCIQAPWNEFRKDASITRYETGQLKANHQQGNLQIKAWGLACMVPKTFW